MLHENLTERILKACFDVASEGVSRGGDSRK